MMFFPEQEHHGTFTCKTVQVLFHRQREAPFHNRKVSGRRNLTIKQERKVTIIILETGLLPMGNPFCNISSLESFNVIPVPHQRLIVRHLLHLLKLIVLRGTQLPLNSEPSLHNQTEVCKNKQKTNSMYIMVYTKGIFMIFWSRVGNLQYIAVGTHPVWRTDGD